MGNANCCEGNNIDTKGNQVSLLKPSNNQIDSKSMNVEPSAAYVSKTDIGAKNGRPTGQSEQQKGLQSQKTDLRSLGSISPSFVLTSEQRECINKHHLIVLQLDPKSAWWPISSITTDSYKYIGQVKEGKMHGCGHQQLKTGEIIVGSFWENVSHGPGAIYFPNGDQLLFKSGTADQMEGDWMSLKGDRYIGEFYRWAFDGRGRFTFSDRREYVGQFRAGLREGLGDYVWPDGSHYEGSWKEGKQHGVGAYTNEKGESKQGRFEMGRYVEDK